MRAARLLGALLTGLTLAGTAAAPVAAAGVCDARADVLTHLKAKYAEAPAALGVTAIGQLVELIAAPDGKTWTLILTSPRGVSCLIAAGEHWIRAKPAPTWPAPETGNKAGQGANP